MREWIFILLIVLPNLTFSQVRDKHWIVGGYANLMSFEENGLEIKRIMDIPNPPWFINGASCISDENGDIALLCNGYFLYDTLGQVIENGDTLTPRKILIDDNGIGVWNQQSIILPKENNQYFVFTSTMSDSAYDGAQNGGGFWFDMLTYHVVEAYGGGKGKVLEKGNILMKNAALSHNRMTAVKHANGRDWWLVKPHRKEHTFYTFLVTAKGISGPFEQEMQKPVIDFPGSPQYVSVLGSSTFSRNGLFYAYTVADLGGVFISRFDRCNGILDDYAYYDIPLRIDSNQADDATYGVSFSPDSKLLYVVSRYNVWQIDLSDTSNNSVQFIHGPDTNGFFQKYEYPSLAPDGRIYIGNWSGIVNTMSVIENPNNRGQACNFCAKCIRFDFPNITVPPNMPYYALGALDGPCDSLSYPNYQNDLALPNAFTPNGDGLNDTWHILNKNSLLADNVTVEACAIYNRWGSRVFTANNIDFSWNGNNLAMGTYVYFIRYRLANGESRVKKGEINLIK